MLFRGQTAQPRRSQFFVLFTLLVYFFKSSFINDDDIDKSLINQSQHRILLIDV